MTVPERKFHSTCGAGNAKNSTRGLSDEKNCDPAADTPDLVKSGQAGDEISLAKGEQTQHTYRRSGILRAWEVLRKIARRERQYSGPPGGETMHIDRLIIKAEVRDPFLTLRELPANARKG